MYYFSKEKGNIWFGYYDGKDCGKGTSKCILTEIDKSFLTPLKNKKFKC